MPRPPARTDHASRAKGDCSTTSSNIPSHELLPDVKTIDDLVGRYHGFVAGITRSGKSVHLQKLHEWNRARVSLYINPSGAVAGVRASSPKDVIRQIGAQERKVYWSPPDAWSTGTDDAGVSALVDQVILPLKLMGERRRGDAPSTPHWCAVFCSEIHKYCWKKKDDSLLRWIAREGAKEGITLWSDSQRPADVNHSILTQSEIHQLYRVNAYEDAYFKSYGIPYDQIAGHLMRPYHSAMLYAGRWSAFGKLPYP